VDFRKRPPLAWRELRIIIGIGVVALATLVGLVGADIRLSRVVGGGGGFYSAWEGARAFLLERSGPYSAGTAALTEELVYGRASTAGENPCFLTVPFFLLPIYYPIALISDAAAARGVWMFLSQASLAAAALLSLAGTGWRPPRRFLVMHSVLAVFGFYPVMALLEGTPAIMLGLIYAGMLWAYSSGRDELAGALIVLSLFLWEVGFVFLVLFVSRVFHDKRWGVLGGFGMTLTILLAISFLAYPGWVLPFLTATVAMTRSSFGFTTGSILVRLLPGYGASFARAITVLVVALLVLEWATGRMSDFRRFVWTAGLGLAATPLIGIRSELSSLVVLFPALALISAGAVARGRIQSWLAGLLLALALVLPWMLFIRVHFFQDARAQDLLYLFYPMISVVGLYWTRWWFLRPPATWLDQVRGAKK
jgi:hypothetical protein